MLNFKYIIKVNICIPKFCDFDNLHKDLKKNSTLFLYLSMKSQSFEIFPRKIYEYLSESKISVLLMLP